MALTGFLVVSRSLTLPVAPPDEPQAWFSLYSIKKISWNNDIFPAYFQLFFSQVLSHPCRTNGAGKDKLLYSPHLFICRASLGFHYFFVYNCPPLFPNPLCWKRWNTRQVLLFCSLLIVFFSFSWGMKERLWYELLSGMFIPDNVCRALIYRLTLSISK